jgi:hypothetical protein
MRAMRDLSAESRIQLVLDVRRPGDVRRER